MNMPIATQDSANCNLPTKRIAMIAKQIPLDLNLGKDYYNALRRMLEHALLTARNAERLAANQKSESSGSVHSPSLTRTQAF